MTRLTAKDFAPELLELYDGLVHGRISRRQFLQGASAFAVAGMSAATILASLSPNYAMATQVEFTDPAIVGLQRFYQFGTMRQQAMLEVDAGKRCRQMTHVTGGRADQAA